MISSTITSASPISSKSNSTDLSEDNNLSLLINTTGVSDLTIRGKRLIGETFNDVPMTSKTSADFATSCNVVKSREGKGSEKNINDGFITPPQYELLLDFFVVVLLRICSRLHKGTAPVIAIGSISSNGTLDEHFKQEAD
jgi:hypothetical protein